MHILNETSIIESEKPDHGTEDALNLTNSNDTNLNDTTDM